jgi:hypothetical protein
MQAFGFAHPEMAGLLQPFLDAHPAAFTPAPDPSVPTTPTVPVVPTIPNIPDIPFVAIPVGMLGPGEIML